MNTKITRVLGLLFFICTFQLNAQVELFNGKSIRANEERQHTFKIKEWVNTPQTFNVLNPDGSNSKLSVDDAQEVIIPNYGHFISVSTSIEISSDLISQLSDKKESISENRTVFMEVLISGPVSLLKLKSEVNTRFYLKKDNDIQLLTYKKFKITDNQKVLVSENQGFKSELWQQFNCGVEQIELKEIHYSQKDLISYFLQYFSCNDNNYDLPIKEKRKPKYIFNVRAGIWSSIGSITYDSETFDTESKIQESSPRIDTELEIRFRKSNPFSILVNLGYHAFDYTDVWSEVPMYNNRGTAVLLNEQPWELNYSNISFGIGAQKAFYLSDNLSIDLNILVYPSAFSFGKSSIDILNVEGFQNDPRTVEFQNNNHLAIGGRVNYKKVSANLKYWPNQSLKFDNELFRGAFQGSLGGFSVQLGYSL